jgi:hypothetical protein
MGYERKAYSTRVGPTVVKRQVMIRVVCRKKEGGKFEEVGCWRLPPLDRSKRGCLNGNTEPERTLDKRNFK